MIRSVLMASALCAQLMTHVADPSAQPRRTEVGSWVMVCVGEDNACQLQKAMQQKSDPKNLVRMAVMRRGEGFTFYFVTPPLATQALVVKLDTGAKAGLVDPECTAEKCTFSVKMTFGQAERFKDAWTLNMAFDLKGQGLVNVDMDVADLWGALDALPRDI